MENLRRKPIEKTSGKGKEKLVERGTSKAHPLFLPIQNVSVQQGVKEPTHRVFNPTNDDGSPRNINTLYQSFTADVPFQTLVLPFALPAAIPRAGGVEETPLGPLCCAFIVIQHLHLTEIHK